MVLTLSPARHIYSLALALATSHNHGDQKFPEPENGMAASNGLEKFSHLEDKIYRTIELTKALRQEKEELERRLASARSGSSRELGEQIDHLIAEREAIREKVQKMIDAIAAADPEIAEAIRA
jgi:FtsZ-binding cell division protein ZapB